MDGQRGTARAASGAARGGAVDAGVWLGGSPRLAPLAPLTPHLQPRARSASTHLVPADKHLGKAAHRQALAHQHLLWRYLVAGHRPLVVGLPLCIRLGRALAPPLRLGRLHGRQCGLAGLLLLLRLLLLPLLLRLLLLLLPLLLQLALGEHLRRRQGLQLARRALRLAQLLQALL